MKDETKRRELSALKSKKHGLTQADACRQQETGRHKRCGALVILLPFGSEFSLLEFAGLHRAFRRPAKLGQVQHEHG